MIYRHGETGWQQAPIKLYQDETGSWKGVTRQVLFESDLTGFQTRYFEVAPGGYTSWEKHRHEHSVIVVRGRGQVRLGDKIEDIDTFDAVAVASNLPHQFLNPYIEPFGFLCIVDRERDKPVKLGNGGAVQASY